LKEGFDSLIGSLKEGAKGVRIVLDSELEQKMLSKF
jgi:hypothetical protein